MRLPMAAISGCEDAKLALMILAVEPRLKGAIIASGPGTSKSLLARSFETILPRGSGPAERALITVPLNVTEDRLLGGLDIEQTLAAGRRESTAGLLAQADGRALYVDEINLLDTGLINHLAAALDSGVVRLEREGLSASSSARFILLGAYDPDEGELSPIIQDRVGLIVNQPRVIEPEIRAEILRRAIKLDHSDFELYEEFECETAGIRMTIEEARDRLAEVRITHNAIKSLSASALGLGVRGNRIDIFAARAARAAAALAGRASVEEEDLLLAINLVLLPRATTLPADDNVERGEARPDSENGQGEESRDRSGGSSMPEAGFSDLIMKAIDSPLPLDLPNISQRRSSRSRAGKRVQSKSCTGGRYVSSTFRKTPGARVAIDATLRAAASNMRASSRNRAGIKADDLRFKVLKRRAGALFIFAVDASGSMAVNRVAQAKGAMTRLLEKAYLHRDKVAFISFRGEEAKVLLQPTRSVSLAKRLIDALPTGGATPLARGLLCALEVAKQARLQEKSESILLIFTDGRANAGLRTGHIADRVQREAAIDEELGRIGSVMRLENIRAVVVDTRSRFVSGGEGHALAEKLGARYLYLPRADATEITSEVAKLAAELNV
jgi:magnesium chelatase subunit D